MDKIEEKEEWRPVNVPGFEKFYEVSSLGRVRSLDRFTEISDGSRMRKKGRILKPGLGKKGYLLIVLSNIEKLSITVHRLVAGAFFDNPDFSMLTVDHIDMNRLNNRADNLRLITLIDNIKSAHSIERGGCYKIRKEDVLLIKSLHLNDGISQKEISKIYSVSKSCINQIIHNKQTRLSSNPSPIKTS